MKELEKHKRAIEILEAIQWQEKRQQIRRSHLKTEIYKLLYGTPRPKDLHEIEIGEMALNRLKQIYNKHLYSFDFYKLNQN